MLLEINPLVLPEIGLVVWSTIAFVVLLFVLGKFAWKPILSAVAEREQGIEDALKKADRLKAEMATLQNENEQMLAQAREERAVMIKEAKEQAAKMINDAKDKAKSEYDRIVADAQVTIAQQTSAALTEVKNQVGTLVIDLSKKVLRRELANNLEQETYINQLVKDVKLN